MNKLTSFLLNELKLSIFNEVDNSTIKSTLVIFPGRFQPFHVNHQLAYDSICEKFGEENVYIATSDIQNTTTSPFSFKEKKKIINQYGIKKVVKVKSPYNPVEILDKYDPATTMVIFVLGEKDKTRLSGMKRLMKYNKTTQLPFKDATNPYVYYVIAAPPKYKIPKLGIISGTTAREALSDKTVKLSELKLRFKTIFGWLDPAIFNLVISKLNPSRAAIREEAPIALHNSPQQSLSADHIIFRREFWDNDSMYKLPEQLVTEGGAYGHMTHIYEDQDLTFKQIKELFELGLSGGISVNNDVYEKTDGLNLLFTFKNRTLLGARNNTNIKAGGLTVSQIAEKFVHIPNVKKAFVFAMQDLQSAIQRLTPAQTNLIFGDGTKWMSCEVIYPATENVINYDGAFLVFHNVFEYNQLGERIGEFPEYQRILGGMLRQVNANSQKIFSIRSQFIAKVIKNKNFDKKLVRFNAELDKLRDIVQCKDTDTLARWYIKWWTGYIKEHTREIIPVMDPSILENLVNKWALGKTSIRLTKELIPNPELLRWAMDFNKDKYAKIQYSNFFKFEQLIGKFATEVLMNIKDFISINPDKSVQVIKTRLNQLIAQINTSGDETKISALKNQLNRIQAMGGIDKLVPTEGIVFRLNGKTYKLTGTFAPINQILGTLSGKFDK